MTGVMPGNGKALNLLLVDGSLSRFQRRNASDSGNERGEASPGAAPPVPLLGVLEVSKTPVASGCRHWRGKKSNRRSSTAVKMDGLVVWIAHIARPQRLRRLKVVTGDDGVGLLNQELERAHAPAVDEESDTPKSTPVVYLGCQRRGVAEHLMRARWVKVGLVPHLQHRHKPQVKDGMRPRPLASAQVHADGHL